MNEEETKTEPAPEAKPEEEKKEPSTDEAPAEKKEEEADEASPSKSTFAEDMGRAIARMENDFKKHSHCIKCHLPMEVCPDTNDGICLVCKGKQTQPIF